MIWSHLVLQEQWTLNLIYWVIFIEINSAAFTPFVAGAVWSALAAGGVDALPILLSSQHTQLQSDWMCGTGCYASSIASHSNFKSVTVMEKDIKILYKFYSTILLYFLCISSTLRLYHHWKKQPQTTSHQIYQHRGKYAPFVKTYFC